MNLFYYPGRNGFTNFGDQLNLWLWDRLLPGVLDDDMEVLFVGIGTLLNDLLPESYVKVIFGAGVGYGTGLPVVDDKWKIYCLRGHLSAEALKVRAEYVVTDPAILVRRFFSYKAAIKSHRFAYMPHFHNANRRWESVCEQLGFGYIDPRWSVDTILSELSQVETLITEAMHGAIVADAFRIPWISIYDKNNVSCLIFKWRDWCSTVHLEYRGEPILPLHEQCENVDTDVSVHSWAYHAASRLEEISRRAPVLLSDERRLESLTDDLEVRLEKLKGDVAAGRFLTRNRS